MCLRKRSLSQGFMKEYCLLWRWVFFSRGHWVGRFYGPAVEEDGPIWRHDRVILPHLPRHIGDFFHKWSRFAEVKSVGRRCGEAVAITSKIKFYLGGLLLSGGNGVDCYSDWLRTSNEFRPATVDLVVFIDYTSKQCFAFLLHWFPLLTYWWFQNFPCFILLLLQGRI